MHPFHIPECFIQNRNVHISVLNGAFCDMEQVRSGICEIGLLMITLDATHINISCLLITNSRGQFRWQGNDTPVALTITHSLISPLHFKFFYINVNWDISREASGHFIYLNRMTRVHSGVIVAFIQWNLHVNWANYSLEIHTHRSR